MDRTFTARDIKFQPEERIASSGTWRFTPEPGRPIDWQVAPIIRNVGFALALAVSPLTHATDPWLTERSSRASTSTSPVVHLISRRRITLREALQIAADIMRRAEEGRLRAAEEEARRFFDMEHAS